MAEIRRDNEQEYQEKGPQGTVADFDPRPNFQARPVFFLLPNNLQAHGKGRGRGKASERPESNENTTPESGGAK